MARPSIAEIRKMKEDVWARLDKTKNKQTRESLSNQLLVLQWVLDERP